MQFHEIGLAAWEKYEIPAKIMHIKKFQLYFMKRAPNGGESAVTEHFFMQIGEKMASEHETRRIGSERKIRRQRIGGARIDDKSVDA